MPLSYDTTSRRRLDAPEAGCAKVHIVDGRPPALLLGIVTKEGIGMEITL